MRVGRIGAGIGKRGLRQVLESGSGPGIGKRGSVLVGVMTKRIKHCIHCSQMCTSVVSDLNLYMVYKSDKVL